MIFTASSVSYCNAQSKTAKGSGLSTAAYGYLADEEVEMSLFIEKHLFHSGTLTSGTIMQHSGSHSGVKLCRWTKSMLRGRGGCYKHSFYGIESHRCMETTPSLACANKCVFCWRHHTNPGETLFSSLHHLHTSVLVPCTSPIVL